MGMKVAGLFAGIGGIELGLHKSGHQTVLLNEILDNAKCVLRQHFQGVDLIADVHDVGELPTYVDLVSDDGRPGTRLSGRTGLAGHVGQRPIAC